MEIINENGRLNNSHAKRAATGLLLIAIAGVLFADNFNLIPWEWREYIFTWQMLLIGIGLVFTVKNGSRSTGIILIGIGVYFLAEKFLGYKYDFHHLLLPSILALIGVIFIFRKKNQHLISGRER